jgi:hypothetical protein
VAGRPPSRGCDGEERHRAHGREAKHNTWGWHRGCRLPSNWRGDEEAPQAPRGWGRSSSEASRSRSSCEGKIHWEELGGDGDNWRRGQRIPMIRWKHTTRQSDCAIGRRQNSPKSGKGVVGDSWSPERGLELGHDRVRERVRGG